ncbi:solute carrier family 41 member 1-like [Sinocyclocheilus grahami]|uniref:solute carrier family 41 member 1-like n=1 Tax=Sinocyclocheilus grahami TaxID=75366 RepID=UPI0007AD5B37|nr:PREDICTED: solute carrier family 41 member 1-like [Sinocyclocheilus grahami]
MSFFFTEFNDYANPMVCAFFVALTPIWVLIARRTPSTREVLYSGWEPVIIAMAISSVGGLILDKTVSNPNFAGMVVILLYLADWMVNWMWHRGMDPDNFSIPYLTALGDLLGTGFLALCFHVLWLIGDRDTDVGD